ncbi:MAG: WXG100 family type VII secretion target [Mycobacterium sp.]
MVLRVDVEHLLTAAIHVSGHSEDLAARHLAADNRLEAAAPGWAGRSAAALGNRAEFWRGRSNTLVARVGEHATDLHSSALRFSAMEERNAAALSSATAGGSAATAIR